MVSASSVPLKKNAMMLWNITIRCMRFSMTSETWTDMPIPNQKLDEFPIVRVFFSGKRSPHNVIFMSVMQRVLGAAC